MTKREEATLALAKAVSALLEAEGKSNAAELLDRLEAANIRMNEAISQVDTFEELISEIGDGLWKLVVEAATQYIKKVGPLGLAEAALKGADEVVDFISRGE